MLAEFLLGTASPSLVHRRAGFQTGIEFEVVNSSVGNLLRQHHGKIYNTRRSAQASNQTRGRAPFGSSTGRVSFFYGSFSVFLLQFWRHWRSVGWSEEDRPWGVRSYTLITDKGQQEVQNDVIVCGCDRNGPISRPRNMRLAACSGHRGMDLAFASTFSRDLVLELGSASSEPLGAFLV